MPSRNVDELRTMVRTHAAMMLQAIDALESDEPSPAPVVEPDVPSSWSVALTRRGVKYKPDAGGRWHLVSARYLDKEAAQGHHAIFIDTLDAYGVRLIGVPVDFIWSDGHDLKKTEAKSGEPFALSWPLFAAGNGYAFVLDGGPRVEGMGLGSIEEPHLGIHVSYQFIFKRRATGVVGVTPAAPTTVNG